MNPDNLTPTDRRRIARNAVEALGSRRSDHALVRVTCSASHRVATVYKTPEGPVVVAGGGSKPHGSRDREDTAHHGDTLGSEYVDMLETTKFEDDIVPARCACGSYTLSREDLREAVKSHTRTLPVA
ncbi:MAG: hypothetical protein WAW17_01120 [Rhodococcus sp. (in: high G+C Gram-positive bacteria)]|uniref:hypothetical protein n=1 Tax=Rhodococcus sp. TaxID=1831 RepID=UPI003BB21EF6